MHSEDPATQTTSRERHLTSHPGFWPAYLEPFLGTELDLAQAFGTDVDDVAHATSLLFGRDSSYTFVLDLPDLHTVEVRITNPAAGDGYESHVDYSLVHPAWSRPGLLATIGPDPNGPGLAWPELRAIVSAAAPNALLASGARLLMLLPILGDEDTPTDEATAAITKAFAAHGATSDAVPILASLVLESPYFGPASWTEDPEHHTGILICDGPDCARSLPIGHGGITHTQSQRLAHILGGVDRA